jgi:hypothetical protein
MAALLTPEPVMALTRVVVQDTTQCPPDAVTNPCYVNVSDAITNAVAGDSIEIRPGIYIGNFTLNKSVSIYGNETASTFLSGNGSGTVLTVDNVTTAMSIRRLSFISATTGILVRNSSSVKITNNVFEVTGTAVQTTTAATTEVSNNTFYRGTNSIASDLTSLNIVNNIFSLDQSGTAIIPTTMDLTAIQNNLFFGGNIGPAVITDSTSVDWKGNIADKDPLLVLPDSADYTARDFHLKAGSPCINAGSTSPGSNTIGDTAKTDIGAYGATSDTIPYPVSGVTTAVSASASINVRWQPNNSYLVSGYRVYYGSASGDRSGTGAAEGASGFTVTTTSATLSGLSTTVTTPAAPVLSPPQSLNESLVLNWTAVPSAKRYNVYYGTTSPPSTLAGTVDTPSFTLAGLTNGQRYYVAVSAVDQAIYYFTITAIDSVGSTTDPSVAPGVAHESNYSNEVSASIGSAVEGSFSNIESEFPESLTPYPSLPGGRQGCFIATAAYGHYSAPEVQALREFRDRYLLTNGPGRTFVGWYYRTSPAAAATLNAHPAYKPAVRAALLPAVGVACLMTRTSLLSTSILLMVFGCAVFFLCNRKRFSRFGGNR